mmetsp:Transcript_25441/g.84145  ORF Transcript_25441/g.84145 Transcript_25441/m.84145 type:complete len:103 (+) Transcript_25441:929-1237(+)
MRKRLLGPRPQVVLEPLPIVDAVLMVRQPASRRDPPRKLMIALPPRRLVVLLLEMVVQVVGMAVEVMLLLVEMVVMMVQVDMLAPLMVRAVAHSPVMPIRGG